MSKIISKILVDMSANKSTNNISVRGKKRNIFVKHG